MTPRVHVVLGSILALIAIALWTAFVPSLFDFTIDTFDDRLTLAVRWLVVLQLPLVATILVVAQQRFWSSDHADGSAPEPGTSIDINRRVLGNTLEQSVLATIGLIAFAILAPDHRLPLVPTLALLFVTGRAAFWIAYHVNAYARAFGLVLTFAPTMGIYGYLIGSWL